MRIKDIVLGLFFVVGLMMILLRTPYYSDDYFATLSAYPNGLQGGMYELTWSGFFEEPGLVRNIAKGAWGHYSAVTGRFTACILCPVLASVPKMVFAFVGTLLFLFLVHGICVLGGVRSRWRMPVLAAAVFALLHPGSVIWLTGGAFYAWPMAWTLASIMLFLSDRAGESALERRNAWMWLLPPLMLIAAGGHELICVPLCAAAGLYWLLRLIKFRRLPINGRMLMTVGYGIGSCLLVFAPGSLSRFSGTSSATLTYVLLCKAFSITGGFILNPWFYAICIMVYVVWKADGMRCSARFSRDTRWCALVVAIEALVLLAFGNTAWRCSWPFLVATMILALRVARDVGASQMLKSTGCRIVALLSVVLGAVTLINSCWSTEIKRARVTGAISSWKSSRTDVCSIPQSPDWLLGFLFDRSFPIGSTLLSGWSEYNGALAHVLGRSPFCGITEAQATYLMDPGFRPDKGCKLSIPGEWYYFPEADMIVSSCKNGENKGGVSRQLGGDRKPDVASGIRRSFFRRTSEASGGIGVFETATFASSFIRDVIYATGYDNLPYPGVIADFPSGRYIVLSCRPTRAVVNVSKR